MRAVEGIFVSAAAAILICQLMIPPVVGLANNGDFGKTYGLFGMNSAIEDEIKFADTRYEFHPRWRQWAGFYSSEQLLVPLAIALNALVSRDGHLDLRVMGTVHGALFLAGLYLLSTLLADAPRVARIVTYCLVLFIFTDVMYVSYLNSFYMDVSAYLFLLLASMFYLRALRWRRRVDAWGLAVCCLMLVTSKAQHAPLGMWIAMLLLSARSLLWPKSGRPFAILAACLALLSGLWIWKSTPPAYSLRGCFTMAFYQILPYARNPAATLTDLGLDESYRRYIGMHAYSAGAPMDTPEVVEELGRRMSYGSLARFFATHPRDTYVALTRSLGEAGRQRPVLGNFDVAVGYPPFTESKSFAYWSKLKQTLFDQHGTRYRFSFLTLAALVGILLALEWRNFPAGSVEGGAALIAMAATELAVSSLADAVEIPRHHLLFYTLFDMLLVIFVYLLMRICSRVRLGT